MTGVVVAAHLLLAVVLLVSGVAKLRAPQDVSDSFGALRVPIPLWAAPLLSWGEIALGLALLLVPAPALVAVDAVALLLMAAYWVVIARALRFSEPVRCSCFGRLAAGAVSRATLGRNTVLVTLAVVALLGSLHDHDVVTGLWSLDRDGLAWLGLLALALVGLALTLHEAPQPHRSTGDAAQAAEGELLDYLRAPIPYGQLRVDDELTTLRLLASREPVLLVALSPGCGPCTRVAPELPVWEERLGVVRVLALFQAGPDLVEQHAPSAVPHAAYDVDGNVTQVLELYGTPSAVLLGADGMLAGGPVTGEPDVRHFVDDIVAELHAPEEAS